MTAGNNWSFETKQIHVGHAGDPETGSRALPIYQTTSYLFSDTDEAAARFALAEPGNIYTRLTNPTSAVIEERIAALEGGVGATLLSAGQAASTFAIFNLAGAGDHIVASPRLYGGTYNLFRYSLPKLGIEVSFVEDPDNLESWAAAVRPNTKAFYAETISNPKIDILDTPGVSQVAHEHGVPLIVDNTIATPYLIQPISQGADIVVHSATKYLGGHGTAIAGVIVDSGNFDWTQGRHPGFTTPDPSYNGLVYADLGEPAYAIKIRAQLMRDYGSVASPFNAFLIAQGLETLSLRVERHVANAQRVAEFLAARDDVLSVNYAGLPSSPWYQRAQQLAPKGVGGVLSFEVAGGIEAGKAFVNALKLHSHVANIGDVRSLVIHPASTTHSQLSGDELLSTGVTPGLVRLAVGIEGIEDILADLELGFAAAAAQLGDSSALAAR
ncbi:bifunctional o-acetylhomoserine/o-acetylserine sulfhydrylase [Mycolicibacter sinensis]|uniref:Bifunctional o-acetylhomoserine/o-acetylserine sulfhydrylase n=1 Tax=Mycolicibacter sinensis (strain JDM601) TaxID=875328 RepID=A0A1A2NQR0_MYCSD|nr:bifunctional o-acetylhomoserine/o-acetylserine sulfhydrylase [Mycolicibacter sinensis]OBH17401.1 bifunctional o-acetylhomoserine/o-acetylserine sulfhydrylase [Mycolicibacter sinensis]OBI32809.1 bifunctional o-acetylhomoserine/o-acetylserine sulfhydrylase [Mycolicibacter sinensis]